MFVRRKYIKGNPYGYLVENEWTKKGSRQKVIKYLGRIHDLDDKEPFVATDQEEEDILVSAILHEVPDDVHVDFSTREVTRNNSPVVLGMNAGVFCSETLQEIFRCLYVKNESRPGLQLASALRNAGIRIHQQDFISLYVGTHS